MTTFFTGEYDSVLMPGMGSDKVIDKEMGIVIKPKPVTELDRLAYVVGELASNFAAPKGSHKVVPGPNGGKLERNEGFAGLSPEDANTLSNWLFTRSPRDPEVKGLYEREEALFKEECLDNVSKDYPKMAWNIQKDATGTVATLKSQLWPGLYCYHRCNTQIFGLMYIGDGIKNINLPFMV
jgi:radial spoke head protein 9